MTRSIDTLADRFAFFDDSAILTQEAALGKFDAWQAGRQVTSELIPVGFVEPSQDELDLLESPELQTRTYDEVEEDSHLYRTAGDLLLPLLTTVDWDIQRGGLEGDLTYMVWAGDYQGAKHREIWHTDNYRLPSVRWTVSLGAGSTEGANGPVSRADVNSMGDLLAGRTTEDDGCLEPVSYAIGTVLRFMNSADIHAGPYGEGPRLMAQATLRLKR